MEEIRLCLRRKLPAQVLAALAETLEATLADPQPLPETTELSGSDTRNERHIQTTDKSESVRERGAGQSDSQTPELAEVLDSCREYQSYFPAERPDWPQLMSTAERLHSMLGIDSEVYRSARQIIGDREAAVTVLCMLETLPQIRSPGAYLRGLCKRAGQGSFNLRGLLKTARAAGLSADNRLPA